MGRRKSKTSATSDHERTLKFLSDRQGEEYHPKIIAGHLQKQYKDERPLKKIYDSVRQALNRLLDEGKVHKEKKGRDTFWSIPTEQKVEEQMDELEQRLAKLIQMEPSETPKFHNIHYYLKRENLGICDKKIAPHPDKVISLFNPLNPRSFYQTFAKRNVTNIRGGVQEQFTYKGCAVTVQCFGSGAVNITINASQTPLEFEDVLFFESWLDALLQTITSVSFEDLKTITTVCWEWNNDKDQTERIDASGKYAITVRQFDDMVSRVYLKHFHDGSVKLRTEQAITKPISYPDWLTQSSVLFSGGVNTQFIIRQQYEHEKEMERIAKTIEVQANAIILNQNLLQKQGMDTAHLQACMEKLAKDMGVDLPNKENTLRKKKEE